VIDSVAIGGHPAAARISFSGPVEINGSTLLHLRWGSTAVAI
jgi:hypothetical protein